MYMKSEISISSSSLEGKKGEEHVKKKRMQSVLLGGVAGFINGLFGGGGGMIVVPLLTFFLKMPSKKAHATAILIILPMSIVSGLLYAFSKSFEFTLTLYTAIGVTAGGILGAFALSKLSNKWIGVIFAVAMAVAGIKMLVF